jgi:hypothetical protein
VTARLAQAICGRPPHNPTAVLSRAQYVGISRSALDAYLARTYFLPLAEAFEEWKAGRLGSLDLSRRMRACLSGPLARLNGKYRSNPYEYQVAKAIVDGILDRGEMSAEALECLAPALPGL